MKNTAKFIIGLLSVLLLGCPTSGGGDDGSGGGGIADLTISNEYIDFRSYSAELTNNTGQSFDNAVFVVSTEATPKDLADIDDTAKVIRNFDSDTLKTRKIYIGWTDEFSK